MKTGISSLIAAAIMVACASSTRASTAYGSLNNFDCVNDTGGKAYGFEIELDDMRSAEITYTYDWNHYGAPKISEDLSDSAHPKVFVRYAATFTSAGWSAYTAIPSGPIAPTDGHQFTDPTVNFGGEHFGVGYYGNPSAVKYNWLIDDGTRNLVHGPPVYVATPTFNYAPPAPAVPAKVQAVVLQPAPPPPAPGDPPRLQFGEATWVKAIKTKTHNSHEIELKELVSDDPGKPQPWANGAGEAEIETETEWKLLQTEFANPGNPKSILAGAEEEMPNGDEVVTRRYEFYKYTGPFDAESGEAMADAVAADGKHGVGLVSYNDHMEGDEWVKTTNDLSIVEVVGDFIGAQMSAFDAAPNVGLIDHIPDGEVGVAYADRTVAVGRDTLFTTVVSTGSIPPGTEIGAITGIFSGTPTTEGVYSFTVQARDFTTDAVLATKDYVVTISVVAPLPTKATITAQADPPAGGTIDGAGVFDIGVLVTLIATPNPGYDFVKWTEGADDVSISPGIDFIADWDHTLVAHFSPSVPPVNLPPQPGADSIERPANALTTKVLKSVLLANDFDPEIDPLTLTGVGDAMPAGSTVSIAGNFVVYTAPATDAGSGSFTYTVSDGVNPDVSATVEVIETVVVPEQGPNAQSISVTGGNAVIVFLGVPGHSYRLQHTDSLTVPVTWSEFDPAQIATAPANGVFTFTVPASGGEQYFRAIANL